MHRGRVIHGEYNYAKMIPWQGQKKNRTQVV